MERRVLLATFTQDRGDQHQREDDEDEGELSGRKLDQHHVDGIFRRDIALGRGGLPEVERENARYKFNSNYFIFLIFFNIISYFLGFCLVYKL